MLRGNQKEWTIKGKVKTMNVMLDKLIKVADRRRASHEESISSLEMLANKSLEDHVARFEERTGTMLDDLRIVVNISNNSLKTTTRGLSVLNEKALNWTGKPLDLGELEKVIDDINCSNRVEKAEESTPVLEKDVQVGPCFRTRSKTKKRVVVSMDEIKDVMDMQEVIKENMASMNVLDNML